VASGLAPEAEAVVATAALAASLLGSDQLPGLLESASGTFAQWSSMVAVTNVAAGLPPLAVPDDGTLHNGTQWTKCVGRTPDAAGCQEHHGSDTREQLHE
jgi:hypothetical protein